MTFAVRILAAPALLLLLPTAILGQTCQGQGGGPGSCLTYEVFAGCSGDCSFVPNDSNSFCSILPDSSKCPSGNSTEVIECTCDKINNQVLKFCFNCGATIIENEDGSTTTITITDATPTSQSAEPVEVVGMPIVTGGPCANEFNAMLKCYGSSMDSEGEDSPCTSFEPADLNKEQPLPTTCAEANDIICNSGLLVGCCNDEIVAIAECLAGANAGVIDCDVDCGGPTSSASYRKVGAAASMAGATLIAAIISSFWPETRFAGKSTCTR